MSAYTVFGQRLKIDSATVSQHVVALRRSDALTVALKGKGEDTLLEMLAVEKHTKNRIFVVERIYIKYKKARERREKIELLTN